MAQNAGTPYSSGGTGADLETFAYLVKSLPLLPDPPGIPFHKQGMQLPDPYWQSANATAVALSTTIQSSNPLPYQNNHFVGTNAQNIHVPQFLSINDQKYQS